MRHFANSFGENENYGNREFLIGHISTGDMSAECRNLLYIVMNKLIYYNNFHNVDLNIKQFYNELIDMEKVEYQIAFKKGTLEVHLLKWEMIKETLKRT